MTFIDITCMSDRSEEVIIETFPRRNDTPFFTTRWCRLLLQANYWKKPHWCDFQCDVASLASSAAQYADYLSAQNTKTRRLHQLEVPMRQLSDSLSIFFFKPTTSAAVLPSFKSLNQAVLAMQPYEYTFLNDFCADNPRKRYEYLQSLRRNGIQCPVILLTHSTGNNAGNMHFVWRVPSTETVEKSFEQSQQVVEIIRPLFKVYHTRAMRKALFSKYGRVAPNMKPVMMRCFYQDLTGDSSASSNLVEACIDERMREVIDLREVHGNKGKTIYDIFWEEASKFINEDLGAAVDDRRHTQVTHLAKAISIRDFKEQVKARCPDNTPIPSDEWLRLQFWPKNLKTKPALQYTGRLNVRYMVQARQFQKTHQDEHDAAAVIMLLLYIVTFVSLLSIFEMLLKWFVLMTNIE